MANLLTDRIKPSTGLTAKLRTQVLDEIESNKRTLDKLTDPLRLHDCLNEVMSNSPSHYFNVAS